MNDEKILAQDPAEEIPETTENTESAPAEETTAVQTDTPVEETDGSVSVESESAPEETVEEPVEEKSGTIKPYHENYYLLYGNSEKNYLDLDGTQNLLAALGFNGGELRQARCGKHSSNAYKASDGEDSTRMFCSYCGLEISGIEYERLPDGRLRCTSCSNTLVKSEMEELLDRVKDNMEAFFGVAINVPIDIEVLDERKLKKKIKAPISMIDDKSMLVLGAAVNSKNGYCIYLENGAPRISVIATFAHELTHIWQYLNWNPKKLPPCSKEKRLLIYEGMAKWVEIQYLYLVGESAVAQREELITRARNDEYGIGFNMYEARYPLTRSTIISNSSPFTKGSYPID